MAITWEISILEFREEQETKYKVTKRFPEMATAETKIYDSKKEVLKQIVEWLS